MSSWLSADLKERKNPMQKNVKRNKQFLLSSVAAIVSQKYHYALRQILKFRVVIANVFMDLFVH